MKNKQKIDLIIAIISILTGVIVLVLPLFEIKSIKWISLAIFSTYTIISCIQFLLTMNTKDYEGLHSGLASFIIVIAHFIWNPADSPKILAMFIMAWTILMSVVKLKKADFYHDRKDKMWKYSLSNLGLFILIGILSSISLIYGIETQIIVLGYFTIINGILELFEPITKSLIAHN